MKVTWMLQISLTALCALFTHVTSCDLEVVNLCQRALERYETLAFPLYGASEVELDNTCNHINASFNCVQEFLEQNGEKCEEDITHIISYKLNSGLKNLYQELCFPNRRLRKTYLENLSCLKRSANEYAACHNKSQISQNYMMTSVRESEIKDLCCFFSWYQECFVSITNTNCGAKATTFVSVSLYTLVGSIANRLCALTPVTCHEPPMPPN